MIFDKPIRRICFLAPPFLSHLMPMIHLAAALRDLNVSITCACTKEFESLIRRNGLDFAEIRINLNANSGSAADSNQVAEEARRLQEFFDATRQGPVETLITQMRHRASDMFANPDEVLDTISWMSQRINPDIWVSDQLSYSVTIALMVLDLPFISFCPPHPATIPAPEALYGVPRCWPEALLPEQKELSRLEKEAVLAEEAFDAVVNNFLVRRGFEDRQVSRFFSHTSSTAVVFNYPCFEKNENKGGGLRLYLGYSFEPSAAGEEWTPFIKSRKRKIFLSFGTFLSIREDVLRRIITVLKDAYPDALVLVAAGASADNLRDLQRDSVRIEKFVPQKELLPHVDVVIHHGGVGTFTESLYFGKPSLVMPFSSDQFNVACDVERMELGTVLDPNHFSEMELIHEIGTILEGAYTQQLGHWHSKMKEMGPRRVARQILRRIAGSTILEEKEKS